MNTLKQTRTNCILIVEDSELDVVIAESIVKMVSPSMTVKHAENGKRALEMMEEEENDPWLIFLDLNMPIMDGFEFMEQLDRSQDQKEQSIVVVSSSIHPRDKQKCSALGILQFIEKPLTPEKYIDILLKANLSSN